MYLSNVFKYTQGLGQKGHQIGRKVGDAIELLTLGMINQDEALTTFLKIENGIEGATSAEHKVEFSFYNLHNSKPSEIPEDLFGLIECKKVGVEQTIKQNFKKWQEVRENKGDFYLTSGYSFTISPSDTDFKWAITISNSDSNDKNLKAVVNQIQNGEETSEVTFEYLCPNKSQLLIALDIDNGIHFLIENAILSSIDRPLKKCIILEILNVNGENKVCKINVNEALPGPQTPEKAKQASFVSLDVRKRVLGHFDKNEDKSFISVLVIGEASHWEEKSRSMIRLCNDYNLHIPDEIVVYLFEKFYEHFEGNSQDKITKTNYKDDVFVRTLVQEIIQHFNLKVIIDMETGSFVKFKHQVIEGKNRLIIEKLE